MDLSIDTTVELTQGANMPLLGLGVYRAQAGGEAARAVRWALEIGYRHVDTAAIYGNETDVGSAIVESSIPRQEVFVTTKVWNDDQGYDATLRAFDTSIGRLGLEWVDLYLVHWPVSDKRHDTWRALERIHAAGRARAIGVSNYTTGHLAELFQRAQVPPAVNQVEFHPFLFQWELLEFCREHGVQLQAYSPLTRGRRLADRRLVEIAQSYDKTPAQILVRWCLQHGVCTLPKSSDRSRIAENADVFDFVIALADMERLNALHDGFRVAWDPTDVP